MSNSDGKDESLSELSEYVKIFKPPDYQNESPSEIHIQRNDSNQRVKNKCVLRKERDRRYRDRHQEKINQRRRDSRHSRQSFQSITSSSNGHSSSSSIQQEGVSCIQVDRGFQKKERDRKYRERHREEINHRRRERRETRLYLLGLKPNCTINVDRSDEVSNRQIEKNTVRKERDRKYRERHREEINQRRRESRHRKQNDHQCEPESGV